MSEEKPESEEVLEPEFEQEEFETEYFEEPEPEVEEPKVACIVDDIPNHDFGDIYLIPDIDTPMKKVLPGSFYMGSDDGPSNERPRHRVNMTRIFWMGINQSLSLSIL